jgi:hypothetical protein
MFNVNIQKEKHLNIQRLIIKTFMASVLAILILGGGSAMAQSQDSVSSSCTLSNIAGSYAFTASGSISPSTYTPFAAVGVLNIAANGDASGSDTANALGVAVARTFTGTVTVNSDCTGTANLNFVGAPFDGFAVANLVFEDNRKGIRGIQVVPVGVVITISARRK